MINYNIMTLKKLDIGTFIGDLPRLINDSLQKIEHTFNRLYNEETQTLGDTNTNVKCKTLSIENSNGQPAIITNSDIVIKIAGKEISFLDFYNKVNTYLGDESTKSTLTKKKLQ